MALFCASRNCLACSWCGYSFIGFLGLAVEMSRHCALVFFLTQGIYLC
jgi:hypothetical protein